MKVAVILSIHGEYPAELPGALAAALGEEVRKHLLAYGIQNVTVDIDLGVVRHVVIDTTGNVGL